jgi:cellulose 1,4-beta-cellobiosidase
VAIPGGDGMAHTYNYCITSIVPLTAAAAAPGTLGAYGAQFNEGKQIVLGGLGGYGVQNDPFGTGNAASMTMSATWGNGMVGFTANPGFSTGTTPGAFPSIVSGWVHGGYYVSGASGGYTGGKTISNLQTVQSTWSWSASGGNYDAAYDVWFSANGNNPGPVNPGQELMIWVGKNGVHPLGGGGPSGDGNAATITGAPAGTTWTVATGTNGTGQPVISYVSASAIQPSGFSLLPFFQDAASPSRTGTTQITTGSFLMSVQAGFELYQSGTYTTSSYNITIK